MNSFILMAQIVQEPQLRYLSDGQTAITEMMVEFPSSRETDPPSQLKVVAWRDRATEVKETYRVGDRVILQGSLRMNVTERPEGYKEKRAELNLSRIYHQGGQGVPTPPPQPTTTPPVQPPVQTQPPVQDPVQRPSDNVIPIGSRNAPPSEPVTSPVDPLPSTEDDSNLDDIPF